MACHLKDTLNKDMWKQASRHAVDLYLKAYRVNMILVTVANNSLLYMYQIMTAVRGLAALAVEKHYF